MKKGLLANAVTPKFCMVGGAGFECAIGTQARIGIALPASGWFTRLRRAAFPTQIHQAIYVLDRTSGISLAPWLSCNREIPPCRAQ